MKQSVLLTFALISALLAGPIAFAEDAQLKKPATASEMIQLHRQALSEIKAHFGFVPQFYNQISEAALPGFWAQMKNVQMNPNTALSLKTKELIGLAVAAQIPCHYCTYFHTKAAKANGATENEVREALAIAGITRNASTLLNGSQVDEMQFKKDIDRALAPKPETNAPPKTLSE